MNFGYLLIVHQPPGSETDYVKMAYALALSIKNTQREGYDKVALVINDKKYLVNCNSSWIFDHVIEWDEKTFWDGRSYMYDLSPFDHTVCLDVDMIFIRDYSHWIDYFIDNCDLYVANRSYTYRDELVTDNFYRKAFVKNELPNLYSFYTFFAKDKQICKDFFSLVKTITDYPLEFTNFYLDKHKPKILGTDEIFSLAAKILSVTDEISYPLDFPRVVHLKPMIQNWPWPADDVTHHVGIYLDKKGKLKIGNYQQSGIVHYVVKDFITDECVNILEEIAWKK